MTEEAAGPATQEADRVASLAKLWRGYSRKVYGPDYPLYQEMAAVVSENLELLDMIAGLRPEAHDPNMLLAAMQYLVLGGAGGELAELYGRAASFGTEPRPGGIGAVVAGFCRDHRDELTGLMENRHIQTNEAGRCGGLALGLAAAATRLGEPIALIDDGASAGLNLILDEYLIDFGTAGVVGPANSPVHIFCEMRGGHLPASIRPPVISRRLGIDRVPVDLDDPDTVRWMLACIWPGTGRQHRARAAMRLMSGRPGLVRRGDMVADLGPALEQMEPQSTVVVTSWSYSYLPPDRRDDFLEVLTEAGRIRPVAWVCCDLLGVVPMFVPAASPPAGGPTPSVLGLAIFDGGDVEARPLAFMHSHGAWIEWLGSN